MSLEDSAKRLELGQSYDAFIKSLAGQDFWKWLIETEKRTFDDWLRGESGLTHEAVRERLRVIQGIRDYMTVKIKSIETATKAIVNSSKNG